MIIISHRGNLDGLSPETENNPDQIHKVISLGFDVEIDIWNINNKLYLGHDYPKNEISLSWIKSIKDKIWCHAKNFEVLNFLLENNIHCFWHETDKTTLTSKKIPWCYPGNYISTGITVIYGKNYDVKQNKGIGICTDYPLFFRDLIVQEHVV